MARKDGKDRGITQRKGRPGWWVRLYAQGRERWHRCDTKSQAKALYGRLKAEAREGKYFVKPTQVPFRELAGEYLAAIAAHRRRAWDDRSRMNRWLAAFGDQDATTITPRQVERVLTDLAAEGKQPATLVRHITVLKAAFNRAIRLGALAVNPALRVSLPKPNNVLVRYLTAEQEATLLATISDSYRPVVRMALNTGLRQGELLQLTWQDVDWNTGILTIRQTKAGDTRRVPMNSTVLSILVARKDTADPEGRIFPHDARYLRRAFDRAVRRAGLAPFRFHDLRHTFASRLAMQGANDRTLMALGGWKSPAMLSRYAHLSPTHLWQAVEQLAQAGTVTKTGTEEESGGGERMQPIERIGAGNGI